MAAPDGEETGDFLDDFDPGDVTVELAEEFKERALSTDEKGKLLEDVREAVGNGETAEAIAKAVLKILKSQVGLLL